MTDGDDLWYPTVDDVLRIHEDIIDEDPAATAGVRDESRVQFALDFVKGEVGAAPTTVHEKAFHLMRLVASNHWFVDGNKRTALNVTELFYLVNGYELDYGDDLRSMLKLFSVREELIDREAGPDYLGDRTSVVDPDEFDPWGVLAVALVALVASYSDREPEAVLAETDLDVDSMRDELGLTRNYGTTVNIADDEPEDDDGC